MTKEEILKRIAEIDAELPSLDAVQNSQKIMMNALYGAFSNIYFRYFDLRIASAITMGGQTCVKGVGEYLLEKIPDLSIITMDTDSNFFALEEILKKRFNGEIPDKKTSTEFILKLAENVLEPNIKEFLNRLKVNLNMIDLTISMEPECISDICLFAAKKKYAMNQVWKEGDWHLDKLKLKIKGLAVVQTSYPQFVRDKLRRAIELIFETADNNALIEFLAESKKEFESLPFEKVGSPIGCKGLAKYLNVDKGAPGHVKAALLYNATIKKMGLENDYKLIGEGDKIKKCYIKEPNKVGSNVIAIKDKFPKEFHKLCQIDYDTQWEKTMLSPIKSLFKGMGWVVTETQVSLEAFFS